MEETEKKSMLSIWYILAEIFIGIAGFAGILLSYFLGKSWSKPLNYTVDIAGVICLFVFVCLVYRQVKKGHENGLNVKEMAMVGIQSAITVVLYFFVKFNLPFFPGWLDIQISELPALITTFAYGPYAGAIVIVIRFLIKLPATITAGVGELSDLILGLTLVVVAGLIYKKHRTIKGAIAALSIGMVVCTILACFTNWLILIPAYVNLTGFISMDYLVGALDKIYPFTVTTQNFMASYIFIGVIPFNLFRYIIVFAFTFILYKRIHKLLKHLTK